MSVSKKRKSLKPRAKLLDGFDGKRILVVADRDRIAYSEERMSGPRMLIRNVAFHGNKGRMDHFWIKFPKKHNSQKGEKIAFTAIVEKYLSLGEDDKVIEKYGLSSIRNFKKGKTRAEAVEQTLKSVEIGKMNKAKMEAKNESKNKKS